MRDVRNVLNLVRRKNFVWLGRLKLNERSGEAAETWDEPEFTIDTKVREFAEHLGCDPRVAQEAYDRMKVDWLLDGEIGRDLREELKGLEAVERSINRASRHDIEVVFRLKKDVTKSDQQEQKVAQKSQDSNQALSNSPC